MKWINVNEKYLDYLREYENRIPRTDYGGRYKPFFGVLFERDNLLYITQVSHPQERHKKLKQQRDFYKIYDPKDESRLIAVINLNYMFPIPKSEVYPFNKADIDSYRTFKDEMEKNKYIRLLDLELKQINTLNLSGNAVKVYENKYTYPNSMLAKRCLDFKMLETYAKQYLK